MNIRIRRSFRSRDFSRRERQRRQRKAAGTRALSRSPVQVVKFPQPLARPILVCRDDFLIAFGVGAEAGNVDLLRVADGGTERDVQLIAKAEPGCCGEEGDNVARWVF